MLADIEVCKISNRLCATLEDQDQVNLLCFLYIVIKRFGCEVLNAAIQKNQYCENTCSKLWQVAELCKTGFAY
jgi:hypothetical protein